MVHKNARLRNHSNCDFVATGIKIENITSFDIVRLLVRCSAECRIFFKHPASALAEAKKTYQVDPWQEFEVTCNHSLNERFKSMQRKTRTPQDMDRTLTLIFAKS